MFIFSLVTWWADKSHPPPPPPGKVPGSRTYGVRSGEGNCIALFHKCISCQQLRPCIAAEHSKFNLIKNKYLTCLLVETVRPGSMRLFILHFYIIRQLISRGVPRQVGKTKRSTDKCTALKQRLRCCILLLYPFFCDGLIAAGCAFRHVS